MICRVKELAPQKLENLTREAGIPCYEPPRKAKVENMEFIPVKEERFSVIVSRLLGEYICCKDEGNPATGKIDPRIHRVYGVGTGKPLVVRDDKGRIIGSSGLIYFGKPLYYLK